MPTYPCLLFRQRENAAAPRFCMFFAPVGEVLEWAAIERLGPDNKAPQRRESPAKVRALRRFLEDEDQNTIPTTIIVTLDGIGDAVTFADPDMQEGANEVTVEVEEDGTQPGLVIDGQHRLLGMNAYREDMPVGVVALLDANDTEKAFQFLVVNNKASKVPTDHLRALALEYEQEQLTERLRAARLSLSPNLNFVGLVNEEEESPFHGLIAWPTNPEEQRVVPPAAVESAFAFIKNKKIPEIRDMGDDVLLEFFYSIWRPTREAWPRQWEVKSKLLGKVGIVCMTQFMTDSVLRQRDTFATIESISDLNLADPADVERAVRTELKYLEERFWEVEWTSKGLDTHAGRALLVDAIVQISRNRRAGLPWYTDVSIVDPSQVEGAGGNTEMLPNPEGGV